MDIELYRNYCLSKKSVTEGFPFSNLPSLLVFKVAGKMFAVADVDTFESIGIRCNPLTIDELRTQYAAMQNPPYFSGRHWTLIVMDQTIPDNLLLEWVDNSYALALKTLTRKVRMELSL